MDQYKFFGEFDLDFNRYKPQWYGVEIEVPITLDGEGSGSITIKDQPFLLYRITHGIIGATYDWETTGRYQDDQYTINLSDDNQVYQNIPINSALMFGSARMGRYLDFAIPVAYSGTRTLNFTIRNLYARVLTPEEDYFKVQICLHGVVDRGDLKSNYGAGI